MSPPTSTAKKLIESKHGPIGEDRVSETYPDYESQPDEYMLSMVQTILRPEHQCDGHFQLSHQPEGRTGAAGHRSDARTAGMGDDQQSGVWPSVNAVSPEMRICTRKGRAHAGRSG